MKENSTTQLFLMNRWEIDGNKAFFCSNEAQVLLEADLIKERVKVLKRIPLNGVGSWTLCKKINNFLILFSDWGNEIVKFDLNSKEEVKIIIDEKTTLGIFDAFLVGAELYAVSIRQSKIYVIDILDFKIVKEINLIDERKENFDFAQSIYDNGKIYVCLGHSCGIVSYDVKTKEIVNYDGDFSDYDNTCTIAKYDKYIFLGGIKKGVIYKCEVNEDKINLKKEYNLYLQNIDEEFSAFHRMEIIHDKLIVIQNFGDEIQLIDCNDESIISLIPNKQFRSHVYKYLYNPRYMYMYTRANRYIGLLDCWKKNIIEFDVTETLFEKKQYHIGKKDKLLITKEIEIKFRQETNPWTLQEFLDCVNAKYGGN